METKLHKCFCSIKTADSCFSTAVISCDPLIKGLSINANVIHAKSALPKSSEYCSCLSKTQYQINLELIKSFESIIHLAIIYFIIWQFLAIIVQINLVLLASFL